jgi:hypothetical protein
MNNQEIIDRYSIVTAIDKNYLKIFDLWFKYFERTNYLSCLCVIVYDDKSEKFIQEKGIINSIRIKEKINHPRDIFVSRLTAIKKILETGKNIIHTDADAFWLNAKLESIIKEDFDIQISIGYGMPKSALKKWGFSLCCGFFILHSNNSTIKLLDKWIFKSIEMMHDQKALNELFIENVVQWRLNDTFYNVGFCQNLNINIEAIDYKKISRKKEKGILIYHPYLSSKFQEIKLLTAISSLMKINSEKFLYSIYYKTLFDPSGWSKVFYKTLSDPLGWGKGFYKSLKRSFKKNKKNTTSLNK